MSRLNDSVNDEEVIKCFLSFFKKKVFSPISPKKFFKMLLALVVTNKGLNEEEICTLVKMETTEW